MTTDAPERLGPYRLIRRIGEGGMGVVHLAVDEEGRELAIKVLHPHVAADLKARDRLIREVETMRRVRSPYVAEVVDAQLTGPQPYVVTRYAPGRTLEETVLSDGPLAPPDLIRLACGLCAALVAIHNANVIHRDLKPANVILLNGEPLVIDFGIAHLVNATRLTQTGMFVGTPGYLAPEIIRDAEITQAADVHALASTVFFAATGQPPFGNGTFEAVCFNIMEGRAQLDLAPAWLRGWLAAALAVNPADRPTASELYRRARALNPSGSVFSENPVEKTRVMQEPPPASAAPPNGTRVLSEEDFADLLPPVQYAPARPVAEPPPRAAAPPPPPPQVAPPPYVPPAAPQYRPPPYPDQRVAGPPPAAPPRPYPPPGPPPRRHHPVAGRSLLAVLLLVIVTGLACLLPVMVSAFAVVVALCLRVGEHLFGDFAERRRVRGSSGAEPLLIVLGTPWALIRSAFGTLVHIPLSAMFGMCVWGILAYGASLTTDRAAAYAAAAFTAGLFVLPGAAKPRKAVSRTLTAVVRSPGAAMVGAIILGTAAFFIGMAALSAVPVFDPWQPPSEVIEDLTREFRRRTDEASMGVMDLLGGLLGSLLDSLGLGFLSFWH